MTLISFAGGPDVGNDGIVGIVGPMFAYRAVGGFLLSALLALATHQGTADRLAATRLTGIALTFTVASAVFYGVAFLWMLLYRAESDKSGAATTG